MSHEVVRTRAGHLAMRCRETGEVMHPGVGPLAEAEALYVRQSRLVERMAEVAPRPLVLFDVGLGAGSNAVAARSAAERAPSPAARLEIVSFERDLGALALALTHGPAFGLTGEHADAARALLDADTHDSQHVAWRLQRGDLLAAMDALRASATRADVMFWDPFSPRADPAPWTVRAFATVRALARPGCTLFTYSASTATRVALLLAGWAVGTGDATGSKAETTAAAVNVADLARPLRPPWLRRLSRAHGSVPLPPDAPPDFAAAIAALPQFLP
ncbi:MAG TPA: MnmC family methyltransferase [Polyangia bacterium]|jgi:queuine tRNA-ribosyltransferase|nr:MnmC family methyltransferase [Polyangia bacterium]